MCSSYPVFIRGRDTHSLCVACLGTEHARSALKELIVCIVFTMWTLRSWRTLFEEGALSNVPRSSGPASAEADRRLRSWGSQMDVAEGLETGRSFSLSSPVRSSALSQGMESCSETISSTPGEGTVLHLSSSEEVDDEVTDKD